MLCHTLTTPIGSLTVQVHQGRVTRVEFGQKVTAQPGTVPAEATPCSDDMQVLNQAVQELEKYFEGTLRVFTVPLHLEGPAFFTKVWRKLLDIPFGTTVTYGEIAKALGSPRASRAVGGACRANPVSIIVPCHRVTARGGPGGYGGGLDAKNWLIAHESSVLNGKSTC